MALNEQQGSSSQIDNIRSKLVEQTPPVDSISDLELDKNRIRDWVIEGFGRGAREVEFLIEKEEEILISVTLEQPYNPFLPDDLEDFSDRLRDLRQNILSKTQLSGDKVATGIKNMKEVMSGLLVEIFIDFF